MQNVSATVPTQACSLNHCSLGRVGGGRERVGIGCWWQQPADSRLGDSSPCAKSFDHRSQTLALLCSNVGCPLPCSLNKSLGQLTPAFTCILLRVAAVETILMHISIILQHGSQEIEKTPEVTYNKRYNVCLGHIRLAIPQEHFTSCHKVRYCFKVYLQAPAALTVPRHSSTCSNE